MSNVEMEELNTSDNIPIIQITENGIEGFEILCRLCANKSDNLIPIYSEEGMTNDLSTKMNLYLPIKVAETDQLPLQCCFQCATTVLNWHELVVASVEADKRLRELHEEAEKHLQEQELSVKMIPGNEERTEIKQDDESDDGRYMAANIKIEESEDHVENELQINIKTEFNHSDIEIETKPLYHDESSSDSESTVFDIDLFRNQEKVLKLFGNCRHFGNDGNISYECRICLQKFGTALEFIEDQISHSNESSLKIDLEDPDLIRALEILDDSKIIKENQTVTHKCQTCQTEISTEVDFIEHQKTHFDASKSVDDNDSGVPINNFEKKETQSFPCDICSKVFTQRRYLSYHQQRFHKTEPPLKKNKRIDNLKKYEIENDGEKCWKCDVCEKMFTYRYLFINHHEIHTKSAEELKRFICEICAKTFRLKRLLQTHMRTHDNSRNFICNICNSAFKNASDIKEHMNIHTDNRPYKCKICSKTFRQRTSLWSHKKYMHSDDHKFSCNLCNFKAHRSYVLKLHMLKHTGEKPYVCSVCGEAYRAMKTLKSHMYTHKKEKLPCEICGEIFPQPRYLQRHMRLKHRGLQNKN